MSKLRILWWDWSVISRSTVSFMYSRLLYAKTRKESRLVSSGQYPCLFHQGASCTTPSCHSNSIARRDKPINVSLSRSGKSCFGARGLCVCVGGGEGLATSKLLWRGCADLTFHINWHKNHTLFVSFALKSIRSLFQLTQYTASWYKPLKV